MAFVVLVAFVLVVPFVVLVLVALVRLVAMVLMIVFVRHVHDVGLDLLELALRRCREHEQRCRISEGYERLADRIAFRIVSRRMLEADHVHPGNSKLHDQLFAFDHDIQ